MLHASFTSGPRYMKNNYLDAMAICKNFGFPDLFITFTCNPRWPEITRYIKERKLSANDRPHIFCKIFKMKLESLMDDLTKKSLLGKTVFMGRARNYILNHILRLLQLVKMGFQFIEGASNQNVMLRRMG